jgi:hypothetical protein
MLVVIIMMVKNFVDMKKWNVNITTMNTAEKNMIKDKNTSKDKHST